MSYRYGTALIPGSYHYGGGGLGMPGALIPSEGVDGPSYLFNDLSLPADAGKEIRGLIVTPPGVGTWFAYEDGSFTFTDAPDGVYLVPYELYVDGPLVGTATITITIGGQATLIGNANLGDFQAAGIVNGGFLSNLGGAAILSNFQAAGSLVSLGDSTLSGNAALNAFGSAGLLACGQTLNLNQDYPGWVVRSYSRGGSLGRP